MTTLHDREATLDVRLLHWTGTLLPAYMAARVCYSAKGLDGVAAPEGGEEAMGAWLRDRVLSRGHWSILEHLSFQFGVRGISRACSHQLVRHRIASYAQQSQRYVSKGGFRYIVPPAIAAVPEALARYRATMDDLAARYTELQDLLVAATPDASRERVNEDARFVLPNACETELVMSLNGRQLVEVSRKRLCSHAQWEIRAMFEAIRDLVQAAVPVVFENLGPDCAWGRCLEGGCALAERYRRKAGW